MRSQSISLFHYEGEESNYESSPCPYEECFETITEKRKYLEVVQLLEVKIKHI